MLAPVPDCLTSPSHIWQCHTERHATPTTIVPLASIPHRSLLGGVSDVYGTGLWRVMMDEEHI